MTKIAAITGGGQGIGRAVALAFAEAGYAVSIADPVEDGGLEAKALVEARGATCLHEPADIASEGDVDRWVARTVAEIGCPTVVVNNAGISANRPFLDLTLAEFDRVQSVNTRGTFLVTQRFAREMVARGVRGSVINIASTRASMSEPNTEAYSASKGAIVALTHAMAMSLGAHGIRVNAISPGWIEKRDWQFSGRAVVPAHSDADKAQHPVGRVGVPGDIAETCLFLAEKAGFVTGQNWVVDGGMTVKMIYV
jgi:NAD(P)-dependent dehydrogenase (short-subunit alcohol dehydrogenase family)